MPIAADSYAVSNVCIEVNMKLWAFLPLVALLSGCQLFNAQDNCQFCQSAETSEQKELRQLQKLSGGNYLPHTSTAQFHPNKPLADYAGELAVQLFSAMHYKVPQHAVAIASFVQFDTSLVQAGGLGNQLAEHMFVKLQQLGIPVADVKLGRQIRVTATGDFVLSRGDYLDEAQQPKLVLAGTMLRDNAGMVINARIMNLQTKAVLSSAQVHIPYFVLTASRSSASAQTNAL